MNHQGDDFVRLQELQEAVTATEQLLEEKWIVGNTWVNTRIKRRRNKMEEAYLALGKRF